MSFRRMRDAVTIKRTIWSNYDKFRTVGVFFSERNEVLARILALGDDEIARIAEECRTGGVRLRTYTKFLTKAESALVGGREIIDASAIDDKALENIAGVPASEFVRVIEKDDGAAVSFNVNGKFDVLQKGNRNGCFTLKNVTLDPGTEFTVVNELIPFWEDRFSVAIKGEGFAAAISAEDPKTGKKGSCMIRIYVMTEDKIIIDDLSKYTDDSALTLWINP